jgi:hypothetical protein
MVFADFCASALFGRVTVSRPLEKDASIFVSSTSWGTWNERFTQSTHRTAAAKVVEIVGEGMKLKADGAPSPRGFDARRSSLLI